VDIIRPQKNPTWKRRKEKDVMADFRYSRRKMEVASQERAD